MSGMLDRFADARILVLDDNLDNLALVAAVLTRAGIQEVVTESRVLEVTSLLALNDPDLVVLDLHMPHVDGFAVLREVATHAAGAYLPVLVVSADVSRSATHRALAEGARDFVTKPFDNAELVLRVRNLLETRFLHRTLRDHTIASRNGSGSGAGGRHGNGSSEWNAPGALGSEPREPRELRRARIEQALRPGGLRIALQPIVDTTTSQTVGFEALSRFAGEPYRSPDQWFAEADEVGLGVELELAAVAAAVGCMGEIGETSPTAFLAVNASPSAVLSGGLPDLIPPELCPRVVLELTEHIPVENYEAILGALAQLRAHGLRLAVDDTGAGYAGFRHLLSLHPEIIKLDISLTRGVDTLASHRALASALAVFASAVGAQLLAEGVETAGEVDTLSRLGLSWMQGYYFGRPSDQRRPLANQR